MIHSLGILLADHAMLGVALELARASDDCALFLMDDAVLGAHDPRLHALIDQGAEVSLCAMDAESRGITPRDRGPRFGSQYDHATLVRDSARIIALTGVRIDDSRPVRAGSRQVAIRITRDAHHAKTKQALRSAAGYAALDLQVTVLVEPAARALLAHTDHDALTLRAITTLRGLGHALMGATPGLLPTGQQPDLVVTW